MYITIEVAMSRVQVKRPSTVDNLSSPTYTCTYGGRVTGQNAARRGRGVQVGLTPDMIVDAAAKLIDSQGLDGFSMRGLAATLGVTPMAIYQHVPTRQALLEMMTERYLADLELGDPRSHWRERFTVFLWSLHGLVHRQPLVAKVLLEQRITGRSSRRLADAMLGALHRAGFSHRLAVEVFTTTTTYTMAFSLHQVARSDLRPDELRDRVDRLRDEAAAEFPDLAAAAYDYVFWYADANFASTITRLLAAYEPDGGEDLPDPTQL